MDIRARLKPITRDLKSGVYQITFEAERIPEGINDLEGDLRVTVKKWKNRRSLNANNYMWALLTEMAEVLGSTKAEVEDKLLQEYGKPYKDADGYVVIELESTLDIHKLQGHWKLIDTDGYFSQYAMLTGTSMMDTAEMSYFLDRVCEEAEQLGIDTATPDERARMEGYAKCFSSGS